MKTNRQKIKELIETKDGLCPSEIIKFLEDETPHSIISHIKHIARSVKTKEKTLFVRPPECKDCEFNDFNKKLNIPSRCPKCKSENLKEPKFIIQ